MTKHTRPIDGVEAPAFFYGTTWKEDTAYGEQKMWYQQGVLWFVVWM